MPITYSVRRLSDPEDKTEYFETPGPQPELVAYAFAAAKKLGPAEMVVVRRWDRVARAWEEPKNFGTTLEVKGQTAARPVKCPK